MARLMALNPTLHAKLCVKSNVIEAQCAQERLIPVVLSEFLRLSIEYPIVVTKNNETGKFTCVSIFGFEKGENLFWVNNTWEAIYKPLNIRRQPFFIGNNSQSKQQSRDDFVICFDTKSKRLSDSEGEQLFQQKTGAPSLYLEEIKATLAELLDGETPTVDFLRVLVDLNLLRPLSLDFSFDNGESQRVQGLYAIDENVLNALSDEQILFLHQKSYLSLIYNMISSLGHFYHLLNRKNAVLAKGAQWFAAEA